MTHQGHGTDRLVGSARAGDSGHQVKPVRLGLLPGERLNSHRQPKRAQLGREVAAHGCVFRRTQWMRCLRDGADVDQGPLGRELTRRCTSGQWGGRSGRNYRQPTRPHEGESQEDGLDPFKGISI